MDIKITILIVAIVSFAIGIGVGAFAVPHLLFGGGAHSYHNFQSGTGAPTNITGTLLANSEYYQYSYLISGNATLSPAAKVAIDDFNITKTQLDNGSITYSLDFSESGKVYNVTIAPNEKLYFIDTNLGDDVHGSDLSFGDDGYAVVNATGYVVVTKYPLPGT